MYVGYLAVIAIISAIALSRYKAPVTKYMTLWASQIIHTILCTCFPIRHVENGKQLPTVKYNITSTTIEKFLRGRENSPKWAAKYGSVYRIWSGLSSEIVLTKPEHIEQVFQKSHTHSKAHANNSGYLMEILLGSCLGLINGQQWKAVKASVEMPFQHRTTRQYTEDLQQFTKRHMETILKEQAVTFPNITLHPIQDLRMLPFLYVASIVFGPLTDDMRIRLEGLIPVREKIFRTVINGGITRLGVSRFLPLSDIRDLRNFKKDWAKWTEDAYELARRNPSRRAPIVDMYESVQEGKISQEQLLQTIDEMLFANLDVMMGGISWTLVFLAAHTDIQEEIRKELKKYSSDDDQSPGSRVKYLSAHETLSPTLIQAAILESARLRPVAAFSVPQSSPVPQIIEGYEIPAGTNFVVDAYALNLRDSFWGDDGDKFRPQRWMEYSNKQNLRYQYWRFGFGPRTCLGKYMADLMLKVVIVEILENGRLSMSEKGKQHWGSDDQMWIHHPDFSLFYEVFEK